MRYELLDPIQEAVWVWNFSPRIAYGDVEGVGLIVVLKRESGSGWELAVKEERTNSLLSSRKGTTSTLKYAEELFEELVTRYKLSELPKKNI